MGFKNEITPSIKNFKCQIANALTPYRYIIIIVISIWRECIGHIDKAITIVYAVENVEGLEHTTHYIIGYCYLISSFSKSGYKRFRASVTPVVGEGWVWRIYFNCYLSFFFTTVIVYN